MLTRRAAYFTDSQVPVIYKLPIARDGSLGQVEQIPITGEFVYGPGFNANGIEATDGGRTLILVKSGTGELFTADAATGATRKIDLGGRDVTNGDGLLLQGRRLYVVENRDNQVTVVKLRRNLTSGRIAREIRSGRFRVPTTIARSHGRFYVVNARFGTPPTPETDYDVVRVPKR